MADDIGLAGFQILHTDLLALAESRLGNVERLSAQLESSIEAFRNLLAKKPRNDQSRQKLMTGKVEIRDEVYSVNEIFKEGALQLAEVLDLDELEAAKIFFEAQEDAGVMGRSVLDCSILQFHQRRKYVLDCLRLILQLSADTEGEENVKLYMQGLVDRIVKEPAAGGNKSHYIQKCFTGMTDIKKSLQTLADKVNGASVLNQDRKLDLPETMEYQRVSLIQQHEALGVIVHYLIKTNHSTIDDFRYLLRTLKTFDKYDNILAHYMPSVTAAISWYGSTEGHSSQEQVKSLNDELITKSDQNTWTLHYVHAAVVAWWLAEYSGWYLDNPNALPGGDMNLEEDNRKRSQQFMEALKDGAFDFMLSISADTRSVDWYDPARHGLRQWLQRKAPPLIPDSVAFCTSFQMTIAEQLETFIDAFITNMPDVLRRLRTEEDEQRQMSHDHELDLERFLVIGSFAFEGRPDAAQGFWSDPDSNLAGFLHWASRRASTPLVSAFCELLRAISEDEDCATSAHKFLLEEGIAGSAKLRRNHSLTWNQIFKELVFFSSKIREAPAPIPSRVYRSGKHQAADLTETEPESAMMLECYLRLIAQLCRQSASVREFLTGNMISFRITDLIFQLAGSQIPSRLRACAFDALESILTHNTKDIGEQVWLELDAWLFPLDESMTLGKSAPHTSPSWHADRIFREISTGFEEPNAFIKLLTSLVSPYEADGTLNDGLPFPEELGTKARATGIDPYLDFALGQVFGQKTAELTDIVQVRLLRLTCLDFIVKCLRTFNEDLVIFANRSNVNVDDAISTSSLAAYVKLHPFSRVMEWVFSDKVMQALFSAVHQDPMELGNASPDSPMVLGLVRGIEVLTMIMDLQATYLDIVRPLIKLQQGHRRRSVANSAFASFEDGVLINLSLINDLGLYCGAGHTILTTVSLRLLSKLSTSPKLTSPTRNGLGQPDRDRTVAALENNNDGDSICRSLIVDLKSPIDLDQEPDSPSFFIKGEILDFLAACLEAVPDRPNIAHLLLGFQCGASGLWVDRDSLFSEEASLFHTVLSLILELPMSDEQGGFRTHLVHLKSQSMSIMKRLWEMPVSSKIVMDELRSASLLFNMFVNGPVIQPGTPFEGCTIGDGRFFLSSSAICLSEFLDRRAAFLEYSAAELCQVIQGHSPSLKQRIFATLQGATTLDDGETILNPTVFNLFDFMELEIALDPPVPSIQHFASIDFSVCITSRPNKTPIYDLPKVEQLLALKRAELIRTSPEGQLTPQEDAALIAEASDILAYLQIDNSVKQLVASRLRTLQAWVRLMLVAVESNGLEGTAKTSFAINALTIILPKLETLPQESAAETLCIARLARSLLFSLNLTPASFEAGEIGHQASDSLLQLFRTSLRAVQSPVGNTVLRQVLYDISCGFLSSIAVLGEGYEGLKRQSARTVKASGERLIDVICDDALSGEAGTRISALLLLGELVGGGKEEDGKYVVECLVRLNFVGLLVDSLRHILQEVQETERADLDLQLSYIKSKLVLLLRICQTRPGAAFVLSSGLFSAISSSGLFSYDPELDTSHSEDVEVAVKRHNELLAYVMRVVNAAVLTRGKGNEGTVGMGRSFLQENRGIIMGVLKRSAGIGGDKVGEEVEELAEQFLLLISVTDFLGFEGESRDMRSVMNTFT